MTSLWIAVLLLFGFLVYCHWRNDAVGERASTPLQTLVLLALATFVFGGYWIIVLAKALLR